MTLPVRICITSLILLAGNLMIGLQFNHGPDVMIVPVLILIAVFITSGIGAIWL